MNIALILPPCTQEEIFGRLSGGNPILPPLDLASIASYLEAEGHSLRIYDCFADNITLDQLMGLLGEQKPQLVGITVDLPSLSSPLLPQAYHVARLLKRKSNPNVRVALIGVFPTKFPHQVLEKEEVDFVMLGEAEMTFAELCLALENKGDFQNIKGLGFKDQSGIVTNPRRDYLKDLDILPLPAYHLLPINKYRFCPTSRKLRRQMSIISSRGCPYSCSVCYAPMFSRRQWRAHSPEYIIKNMDYLNKHYGIEDFQFRDEIFTLNRNRTIQFCSLLKKHKKKYSWNCYATFHTVDDDLVCIMNDAGCYQIDLGVEVGTSSILKKYKNLSIDLVRQRMKMMKRIGMETRLFFIIGPPSETTQDVERTIELAIELDPDYVLFTPSAPYPGTELYDQLSQRGITLPDFEKKIFVSGKAICDLPGFKKEYIDKMVTAAYKRFYIRPQYILKKLFSIRSFYQFKSCLHGFMVLKNFLKLTPY